MNPKMIAKQIIDFNKATFDHAFETITVLQNYSEKMVGIYLEKATFFPPEGKKVIVGCLELSKKGRKDFKTSVDDSFKTLEDLFVGAANTMGFSIYGLVEKTDQSLREVTNEIKKASVEVMDKSIQTIANVADKALKQTVAVKKGKVIEGKPGLGISKATRKTVKTVKK